jgi:hypothetical protein
MNIPTAVVWEIVLVILGFVFGTLWGHHDKISQRVTHHQCSNNREKCPCIYDVKELQDKVNSLQK